MWRGGKRGEQTHTGRARNAPACCGGASAGKPSLSQALTRGLSVSSSPSFLRAGFTGQIAVWCGITSTPALVSIALSLAQLSLCVGGLLQRKQPLWMFQRVTRRNIVLAQFALTSLVEAAIIPHKGLVAAIWATKWVGFAWYVTFGRHDAERSSGLTVGNVWGDHDNFHVIACVTAAMQIAAAALMG